MRHDRDRIRQAVGDEVGALDRIDRDVDLESAAPEFLADEEHRRFVALAFTDHDAPVDLHLVERVAHLFDGGAVGDVAFTASHPARGSERRALGDLDEVERVDQCPRLYKGTPVIPLRNVAVSTHAHAPHPSARTPVVSDLLAAGPAPCTIVAVAGFTIGFFAWLGLVVPRHNIYLNDLGLLVALAGGTGGALWLWQSTRATFRAAQGDICTLAALRCVDVGAVRPAVADLRAAAAVTHGESRLFVACAGLFCVVKVLVAARFNQTVRDVRSTSS